jgi:hypothetical protein
MDGWTRLLIVGGVTAIVVFLAAPYIRGEMGEIGRQVANMGNHSGIEPWDQFGLRPRAEASDRDPGRIPPGLGNADGDDPGQYVTRRHQQWRPGDDPSQRPWRLCEDSRDGRRKRCTDWQTGPVPREYGRR